MYGWMRQGSGSAWSPPLLSIVRVYPFPFRTPSRGMHSFTSPYLPSPPLHWLNPSSRQQHHFLSGYCLARIRWLPAQRIWSYITPHKTTTTTTTTVLVAVAYVGSAYLSLLEHIAVLQRRYAEWNAGVYTLSLIYNVGVEWLWCEGSLCGKWGMYSTYYHLRMHFDSV